MALLGFLILFPLAIAFVLFFAKNDSVRKAIVIPSASAIALASCFLAFTNFGQAQFFRFSASWMEYCCIVVSIILGLIILCLAIRYKNALAVFLAAVQLAASCVFEFAYAPTIVVTQGFYFDNLSLILACIIGVVGSGICVYALGYMKDFQEHEPEDEADRRPLFFALMFMFLSAMYLIVFSNNMAWLFTGWEITTVCSFLLIGYTRTPEAIKNSFRQINMNLVGGLTFLAALFFCVIVLDTLSLQQFIELGSMPNQAFLFAIPATLLAISGLTKAAQMPFHTWLLGAMVAPTPTSALLHSSTMVKAGVFLLIKISPVFAATFEAGLFAPAALVMATGGISFLLCSCMAITQTNAKRVLAYSTIANLGLITMCAGVGTPEAIWAAIFLVVFHAVAKSLLFLCVGTAEHHIGSRDIEDMDLLFERMPKLARLMMLGIMGMFVAPFGMLISKWATIVSLAETGHFLLLILLALGSAVTFMFWAKWLGKLSGIVGNANNVEKTVTKSEWLSLGLMAGLVVLVTVLLPLISQNVVEPYLSSVFSAIGTTLSDDNLLLCSLTTLVVFVVLFAGLGRSKAKRVNVYLAGVSAPGDNRAFRNSLSGETTATARNMYLPDIFGEKRLAPMGTIVCAAFIVIALGVSLLQFPVALYALFM